MAEIYNRGGTLTTHQSRWPQILLALAVVAALIIILAIWVF